MNSVILLCILTFVDIVKPTRLHLLCVYFSLGLQIVLRLPLLVALHCHYYPYSHSTLYSALGALLSILICAEMNKRGVDIA